MVPQQSGVRLTQVYASDPSNEAGVDIIAIHGLDTKSPDTWLWKSENPDEPGVNWLADPKMLPSRVGPARIFTCDWPADMCRPSDAAPMELREISRLLLSGIESRYSAIGDQAPKQDRPIIFIASCLGGIILMQALVMAEGDYLSIRKATRGVAFLATPFRGTSFEDIAKWAEPGLRLWASVRSQQVTTLLDNVKGPTFDLDELVRGFTRLCLDWSYQVHTFYESRETRLHTKIPLVNWCPHWLLDQPIPPKQLVDKSSASLDIVRNSLPLDRPHVTMNKFSNPEDCDYNIVSGRIEGIIRNIRDKSPLAIADAFIRAKHYTPDRLRIVRLSGTELSMDQCYINLAILEQKGGEKQGDTEDQPSRLSLFARLRAETPDEKIQADLQTIFTPRKGSRDSMIEPRRILIRGRAGVGKTTLCKKMVHEFTYNGTWSEIFDRLFWLPLRKLKNEPTEGYNLGNLLYHEFFSQLPDGSSFAKAMWRTLEDTNFSRALFILDGLDEVSEGLVASHKMHPLLKYILSLPNVIITSRPYIKLPDYLGALDLEVETIGFYPDQVDEYLKKTIDDQNRVDKIQSFLQGHSLIQSLVRIPIQLDALCYTWEDDSEIPQTMTAIYEAIELKLWKKDIVRLGIRTEDNIQNARSSSEIGRLVTPERHLLEALAFSGLHNDTMNFDPKYRDKLYEKSGTPTTNFTWDDTLTKLSFLRTSDPSSKPNSRSYHFLHLTFQEYFAARYFVRHWNESNQVQCLNLKKGTIEHTEPADFLRKHKYTAHYDVFWRFVCGLLDAEDKALSIFEMIEDEPRDLLGPTHQRLVMHCLNEVSDEMPMRGDLEQKMIQLASEEYDKYDSVQLVTKMEFPEHALHTVFRNGSDKLKLEILQRLETPREILPTPTELAISYLGHEDRHIISMSVEVLAQNPSLPNDILTTLMALLEHNNSDIRDAASWALGNQSALPDSILTTLAALLEHNNSDIRLAAVKAFSHQSALPDSILTILAALLEHNDLFIQHVTAMTLQRQSALPDSILMTLVALLEHDNSDIRNAASWALCRQSALPNDILTALVALLEHEFFWVGMAAAKALNRESTLPGSILTALVAQLEYGFYYFIDIAARALGQQSALPNEILEAITARLNHEDVNIRSAMVKVLYSQLDLHNAVIEVTMSPLEKKDPNIGSTTMSALQHRSTLPNEILEATILLLEAKNAFIRLSAIQDSSNQLASSDELINTVVSRLEDEDARVRRCAVEALGKLNFSDDILKSITARLEDTDEGVVCAALYALRQPHLPNDTLKVVVARLGDGHSREAVEVLGRQSTLPDEILKAMLPLLKSGTDHHKEKAESIMRRHAQFYQTLPNTEYAASVYMVLLRRSFREQLSWYIEGDSFCINTPEGFLTAPILNRQEFMDAINEVRPGVFPSDADTNDSTPLLSERVSQHSYEYNSGPHHGQRESCLGVLHAAWRKVFLRLLGREEMPMDAMTEPLLGASR